MYAYIGTHKHSHTSYIHTYTEEKYNNEPRRADKCRTINIFSLNISYNCPPPTYVKVARTKDVYRKKWTHVFINDFKRIYITRL